MIPESNNNSMSSRKKIVFSLVLLGLCVGLIEGTLRLFMPNISPMPVLPLGIGQYDPDLGWCPKPGAIASSDRFDLTVEYKVNSKGLRGPLIPYERTPGTFRILLLGDSQTYGYGVPIEKHFSHLLPGYFKNVEVVNLGVSGYGVDQELLIYRKKGQRFQPDLVISFVPHYKAHRHMHSRRWSKEKPHFILQDGELIIQNTPVPNKNSMPQIVENTHNWLQMNSTTYRTGLYFWERILVRFRENPADVEYNQYLRDNEDPAFLRELHSLGGAIIRATAEEVEQHGSAYMLASSIPELIAMAKESEILHLDTSLALNNPAFELPQNHSHINEAGNGVLAWELAKLLKQNNLVPEEHW